MRINSALVVRRTGRIALLLGVVLGSGLFVMTAQAGARNPQGPAPQTVAFPYWAVDGYYTSAVTLNNPTGNALVVQPTLYNASGQSITVPSVTLAAKEQRVILLADWIPAAQSATFKQGSLIFSFNAPSPGYLGAQVAIRRVASSLQFDVPPEMPASYVSTTLEGMWWRRATTNQAKLVLTNTGATAVSATVRFTGVGAGGDVGQVVPLGAHATSVIDINTSTMPSIAVTTGAGVIRAGGIRIVHNGVPGAVVAYGMLSDAAAGFSTHSSFVDPDTIQSQSLIATHVMVGAPDLDGFAAGTSFTAVTRLRNVSGMSIDVTPVVTYKLPPNMKETSVTLPVRTISGNQLDVIDLNAELAAAAAPGPYVGASVRFDYTGETNALMAQTTSMDATGNLSFEVPSKDPGVSMNRYGGSYPWRLDGDYHSVVHLRNTTNVSTAVTVQLDYDGGSFTYELLTMEPQQQLDVDLRNVRDQQVKDGIERALPPGVTSGRLTWFEHGDQPVVGRMEIYSPSAGISSSFSCGYPCCPGSTRSVNVNPSIFQLDVAGIQDLVLLETRTSNCGDPTPYGPFNITVNGTFTVTDGNVGSVTRLSKKKMRLTGAGVGNSLLKVEYPSGEWIPLACHFISYLDEISVPVEVGPTLEGPFAVTRGESATFRVNLGATHPTGAVTYDWTYVDSNQYVVTRADHESPTWSGPIVRSGIVSVQVRVGSLVYFPTPHPIAIIPRQGWMFPALPAVRQLNRYNAVLTVPRTPVPDKKAGISELQLKVSAQPSQVETGPNAGYVFIRTADLFDSTGSSYYYFVIADDYDDPTSTFYKKQCGDYEHTHMGADTIDTQRAAIIYHESGLLYSHYAKYLQLNGDPSYNLKPVYENLVANPNEASGFGTMVNTKIQAARTRFLDAVGAFEPCGDHIARLPGCGRQIVVNFPPYPYVCPPAP